MASPAWPTYVPDSAIASPKSSWHAVIPLTKKEKRTTAYWERKRRYLDHLEATDDERAVLVSIADKAHNARALVTDLHRAGTAVLRRFNGTPSEILEYYTECVRIARQRGIPEAVSDPLDTAVAEIARLLNSDDTTVHE